MSLSSPVPVRLDSPTGQHHAGMISAASRIIYEYLCRTFPTKPLSEIASIHSGGTPSKANPSHWGGDIFWAAPRDLKSFLLGSTNTKLTQSAIDSGELELHLPPATLLVTRGMILSRYVPISHATVKFTSNQDIRIVKSKNSEIDGLYLSSMLLGAERSIYAKVTDSTAGQRRIETPMLLSIPIPIVPVDEQRQIGDFVLQATVSLENLRNELSRIPDCLIEPATQVARIEELSSRLEQVESYSNIIQFQSSQLLTAAYKQLIEGVPRRKLGEVAPLTRRPASIDPFQEYPSVSVRSFGRGTFHNPPLLGSEITWEKPHLVKAGDILISNIKAWEGAIAVARLEDDGRYGSHRYLTYVPMAGVTTSRFLCFHLLSQDGLKAVGEASPGSADRNRTTSAKALLEIQVPVPSYERQLWFGEIYDKVEEVRFLQAESTAERNHLLPAILNRAFQGQLS